MTAVHILVTALFLGLSCRWLGRPWRQCLLLALVGTGLLIAGFAELASAFTALRLKSGALAGISVNS